MGNFYFASIGVQSIVITVPIHLSVCLSVCMHILKVIFPNFTKFSIHVTSGLGSVLL